MQNGINVEYSLDPDYFEVGCAYQLRLSTNDFRIALLTKYSKKEVTFKILEKGEMVDLILSIDQLRFRDYWLTKMKPDYKNGKFSVD